MVSKSSNEISSTDYISLKQKYESSVTNYEKLNQENIKLRNERDRKTAEYTKCLEELKEKHKQKVD
jgi:predicted nuclease with TOPRIM domain